MDVSYHEFLVPSLDFTYCSYHGPFVPSSDFSYPGFYPGSNMRGCESQGVAKPEARRAEGGVGFLGRGS